MTPCSSALCLLSLAGTHELSVGRPSGWTGHGIGLRAHRDCRLFLDRRMFLYKLSSVALVLKQTIPTERPPLVGEISANWVSAWIRHGVGIAHTVALSCRLDGPGSIPGSSFSLVFVFCCFCVLLFSCVLYLVFYLLYLVLCSLHLYCTVKFCEICCSFVRCMFCFLAMYVHYLYVRPIFVTLPPGISPIAVIK
jgi:hypothetical protein